MSLDNGHICYGYNDVSGYNTLKSVENAVNLFFEAPFNGDYYKQGITNSSGLSMVDLLEHLKMLDYFPQDILIPAKEGQETITVRKKAHSLEMGWN